MTLIRLNQPLEALAILDRLGDRLEGDGEARPMRASVAYNRGLALCLSGDEAKGRTIVADLVSEVLVALEKSRDDDERRFLDVSRDRRQRCWPDLSMARAARRRPR